MSNFNKELFSQLLTQAKGDRSLNQYGLRAGVDPGYISRFINLKRVNPPTPDILKKLADAAYNEVSYENLMEACGYLRKFSNISEDSLDDNDFNRILPLILRNLSDSVLKYDDKENEDLTRYHDLNEIWKLLSKDEKISLINSVIKEATYNKSTGGVFITQYFIPGLDPQDFQNIKKDYLNFLAEQQYTNIKEPGTEELPDDFSTPEEAMKFLLAQKVIMGFGGFDIDKLSDDEKVDFANELLGQLKMLSYKYKK